MNNLPKFLEAGQSEPKLSTKEYWDKFNFAMLLHPSKIQVDDLLTKQSQTDTTLTVEEALNLKISKASFIMAIGEQTLPRENKQRTNILRYSQATFKKTKLGSVLLVICTYREVITQETPALHSKNLAKRKYETKFHHGALNCITILGIDQKNIKRANIPENYVEL